MLIVLVSILKCLYMIVINNKDIQVTVFIDENNSQSFPGDRKIFPGN